jgi:hypothetical protein
VIASKDYIDSLAREYKSLVSDLDNLTPEQLEARLKAIQKIGGTVKEKTNEKGEAIYQISEPTIRIGTSKATMREVPVSQLSSQGAFRYSTGLFTGELGAMYKRIAEDVGIKGYTETIPETKFTRTDWFGTGEYNILTGRYEPRKEEITIPESTSMFFTPSQIGGGIETFGQVVTFAPTYFGGLGESIFVGSEFGGQTTPLEYVKSYPLETIGIVGGGLFALGSKGYRWIKTPKIQQVKLLPKMSEGELYMVSKPLTREIYTSPVTGKTIMRERYNIGGIGRRIIKEGRKTVVTSRFGTPIYEGVYKADVEGYERALKLLEKRGYTTSQAKEILRLQRPQVVKEAFKGKLKVLTPEEGEVNIFLQGFEDIRPLKGQTRGINWLKKESVRKFIKTTGTPEGEKLLRFSAETEKAYLKGESAFTKLREQGKLTNLFGGFSGSKAIKEYPLGTMYKQFSLFKQLNPKMRKLLGSKAKVFVYSGEPAITVIDESILPARGFKGGMHKSSPQFFQQLYKTDNLASAVLSVEKSKPVFKPSKPRNVLTGKTTKAEAETIPLLGISSRMEEVGAVSLPSVTKESVSDLGKVWLGDQTITKLFERMKAETKAEEQEKFAFSLGQSPLEGLTPLETQAQREKQRQKAIQRELQKERQLQSELLIIKQRTKQKQPTPTPTIPKIPIWFPTTPIKSQIDIEKIKSAIGKIKVFGKRYGKHKLLGEFVTEPEAARKLKGFLTETLGASGYVEKAGRKIRLNLGLGFRPSKRDIFRVVQERRYRLGTQSERKEIQRARKNKKIWRV